MYDFESIFANPLSIAPPKERAIVERVARHMGVSPVPEAMIDARIDHGNAYTSSREHDGKLQWGVFLQPDALAKMGESTLCAVIAHEMDHIINDDFERIARARRKHELDADALAAKAGYGEQLSAFLQKLPPEAHAQSDSHPSVAARVKRLTGGSGK